MPLLQVPHPAVHQFGAATGGALGEIVLLHQHSAIAPAGRIHRHPQPAGPAADDHDIPRLACLLQRGQGGLALHGRGA